MSFLPLPIAHDGDGQPRRVGVELEFAGIEADAAAAIVRDEVGGAVGPIGLEKFEIRETELGRFRAELDTALAADGAQPERIARTLARPVIPIEVICPPVRVEELPRIDALARALAAQGAQGTSAGTLYAYGMHFNVTCASLEPEPLWRVATAFALLEDWLRDALAIDLSRRALPFVDPYPRTYLDALAEGPPPDTFQEFAQLYLRHNPTRNRSLDLTTIVAVREPDAIVAALGPDHSVSARPTFHYRLPDCRLDEPGWSLSQDWNRWVLVEMVAANPGLLSRLARDWRQHRDSWTTMRYDWRRAVEMRLRAANLV